MATEIAQRVLSEPEAAKYLGLSPLTLRNWRYDRKRPGRGPKSFKLGSRILYDIGDLDRYLDDAQGRTDQTSAGAA